MEKKLYTCNYEDGYFAFLSDEENKEKDATNLAFENFGIDASEIWVELADEDETLRPVNEPKMSNNQIRKAINKASAKGDITEVKLAALLHNNKRRINKTGFDPYLDIKPIYLIV